MQQTCQLTGKKFTVSDAEKAYCEANNIPLPTIYPFERLRRLFYFRNRPNLYNSKCAFSNKSILSCIPPEKNFKVYDIDAWESDKWDGLDYGKDYDFKRPFFEQLYELLVEVPMPNLSMVRGSVENSDYTNGITGAKNCYLLFGSSFNEDCLFSRSLWRSRDLVDCFYGYDSELCYDCIYIRNCYQLFYSSRCSNCSDSYFLENCQSCKNCYGCVNLNHKEYYFYNKALTKDEYQKKLSQIDLSSNKIVQEEKEKFNKFKQNFPIKYIFGSQFENSSGNYLQNTKNCLNSYFVSNSEDVDHSIHIDNAKNCFFMACYGSKAELIYNCHAAGDNAYNLKFCTDCWDNVHDLEYCKHTSHGSGNSFGCVSLKRKNYCILNKQYSKEEYNDLIPRIKKHMLETGEYGQFFPLYFSPFYYNHSEANDYFPLTKEEALKMGFPWIDEKTPRFDMTYNIPDKIADAKDDILEATLKCSLSGKKFKIIKQELEFYRRNNIPIPQIAPMERLKLKTGICKIYEPEKRSCNKCGKVIKTTYSPQRPEIVYCEECYLKEVY